MEYRAPRPHPGRRRRLALAGALAVTAALAAALASAAAAAPAPAAGGPLRATVVGSDQRPVVGARVELLPLEAPYERARRQLTGEPPPPVLATATTGADGRFEIAEPPPGPLQVRLAAAGLGRVEVPAMLLHYGWGRDTQVAMPPENAVEVRVEDAAGRPVAGARLMSSGSRLGGRFALTGEDGRGRLPRREYERSAVWVLPPPGRHDLLPPPAARPGDRAVDAVFAAAAPRALAVTHPDGRPAAGVLVELDGGRPSGVDLPLALSGKDGRAVVPAPLRGEPLALCLTSPDGSWAAVSVPAAASGDAEPPPIEARLEPPTEVTLDVRSTRDGEPVAGAAAWWFPDRHARGGNDGSIRFLVPFARADLAERSWLFVEADGFQPADLKVGPDALSYPVRLQPASSLAGRVVDAAGRGVEGAMVRLGPDETARFGRFFPGSAVSTTSGAEGGFLLGHLPSAVDFRLRAEAAGFAPMEATLPGLEAGEVRGGVEVQLEPEHVAFARLLGAGGAPVAGAALRLVPQATGGGDITGEGPQACAADGRCTVRGLASGRFDLLATAPGHAPALVRGLEVPEAAAGPVDLGTVHLERGAEVTGRILDPSGTPVGGAEVWTELAGELDRDDPERELLPEHRTHSGADGRFLLDGHAAGRPVDLFVRAEGYPALVLPGVEPPARHLEAVLEAPASVAGVVVDEDGGPVPEAMVHVQRRPTQNPLLWRLEGHDSVTVDEAGRFELGGLAAGGLSLEAAGGWRGELPLELQPGERREGLRLVVRRESPGLEVRGRVVDPAGEPLAGVRVTLETTVLDANGQIRSGSGGGTGADGTFRITATDPREEEGAGEPRTELVVDHRGYREVRREIDVATYVAGGGPPIEIVLVPGGGTVSGRVTGGDGSPLADARLSLRRHQPGVPVQLFDHTSLEARSAADGRYRFDDVEPGSWELIVRLDGWIEHRREGPLAVGDGPLDGVDVALERGAVLHGRILGLDERELAGVQVRAWGEATGLEGRPDHTGRYRLPGAAEGRWQVSAYAADGRGSASTRVEVGPGDREVETDLEFEGGFELRGELWVNGEPRAGAGLGLLGQSSAGAVSDHQGRFRFPAVAAGAYRLTVREPMHTQAVEVAGDQVLRVDIASAVVHGRVVDEAGEPVEAGVALRRLADERGGETSVVGTAFRFEAAAGDYRLRVTAPGYLPVDLTLNLTPGGGEPLEVVLRRGGRLLLQLAASPLPPPQGLLVLSGGEDRRRRGAWYPVDAAGRVTVEGLAAGRQRLWLAAPGRATVAVDAEVPGPPQPVELPPEARLSVEVPALADDPIFWYAHLLGADGRRLAVLDDWGQRQESWRLLRGVVEIGGLPAGTWTLEVSNAGRPARRAAVTTVTTVAGTTQRVELE